MPSLRDAVTTALAFAALWVTGTAFGQSDPPQAFRIEFSAPAGCGDSEQFGEEILKRTDRLRPAERGETALGFFVHLTRTDDGVRGQFAIREPDGALSLRDVPGRDCREVLSAMALIAALTVDPLARADREVPVAQRRRLPKREPPRSAAPAPPRPPPAPEPAREAPRPGYGFAIGQRVTVQSAVMPGIELGLGVHAEVASKAAGLFAPLIRVGALIARSGTLQEEHGTAELDWITARVTACPIRFGSDHGLSVRPCAFADAGRLHGAGDKIANADEKSVFWTAAGAEATAAARIVGPLRVGVDAGILVPLRRDRFVFDVSAGEQELIHEVPVAGFSAGIGLGLPFF
jgi:hypothetical protein